LVYATPDWTPRAALTTRKPQGRPDAAWSGQDDPVRLYRHNEHFPGYTGHVPRCAFIYLFPHARLCCRHLCFQPLSPRNARRDTFCAVPNQSRLLQTHGTGYTTASRYALSAPPAPEKDQKPQQSYDQKNARRVLTVSHWAPGNTFSGYAQVRRTHYARASDEMYAIVRLLRRGMLCDTDHALFTNAAHW